ncbi:Tna1p [Sugiyamaella lignohabitans]|uniref:Tna1p n=1 Tax=Sugiyamaella lignohabitans TaxID=796027 RepID=A0A167D5S6_9ASCO|nr:Tna1p [Sugiyamaella lignohabitans]ANB12519.1 Tna1p [Sugiyamaella lignohabitans]
MRKLDLRIVPAICILYLLAFLERTNISNANVYGMGKDLKLKGNQYNTALTVFFVPYILFEVPSNILLKKFTPHVWLSFCMFIFGIICIAQGFVKSFGGLVATRFIMGAAESGAFPGCFYLLAMFYRREEAQKRYSFFFSSTCLAGAFGGLIAAGVSHIDGKLGIAAWSWLFIIEGAVCAFVAIIMFFFIADFPEDAKFLTDNERAFLQAKLALDSGDSYHERKYTIRDVLGCFKDWKIWFGGFMYFGLIVPAYGYAYFANAILVSLKYTPLQVQYHSIPPWVVAFALAMITATISDRIRHRYLLTLACSLLSSVGFIILLSVHGSVHARYGACFLVAAGTYSAMPLIVCWTAMNFAGHLRRGVGTGWQVGFGNIGGIIATFTFLSTDAPYYTKGIAIGLGFTVFSMASCLTYFLGIHYENKQKRSGARDAAWNALTPDEQAKAGDFNPEVIYQY